MKKKFYACLFVFCAALLLGACGKADQTPSDEAPGTNRAVLIYMFGDLDEEMSFVQEEYINRLEAGWDDGLEGSCYVYLDPSFRIPQFSDAPVLLKITADKTPRIVSTVVKTYEYKKPNDLDRYREVQNDLRALAPADSYGLMFFGHGSGWLPAPNSETHTKAIGGEDFFDIIPLAEATTDGYEFILFHNCQMSNIEALYEFRHKAEYFFASEFVLDGAGLDWANTLPFLYTSPKADLYRFTLANANFYKANNAQSTDEYTPCTFALIHAPALEQLAAETRKLVESGEITKEKVKQNQQDFYFVDNYEKPIVGPEGDIDTGFADFRHAVYTMTEEGGAWNEAYGRACLLFSAVLDPQYSWRTEEGFPYLNGISVSFPQHIPDLEESYNRLAWGLDSGMGTLK